MTYVLVHTLLRNNFIALFIIHNMFLLFSSSLDTHLGFVGNLSSFILAVEELYPLEIWFKLFSDLGVFVKDVNLEIIRNIS